MCVCVSCIVGDSALCEPFCLPRDPRPPAPSRAACPRLSAMADLAADGTLPPAPKRARGGRGRTRVIAVPAASSPPLAAPAAAAGAQEECAPRSSTLETRNPLEGPGSPGSPGSPGPPPRREDRCEPVNRRTMPFGGGPGFSRVDERTPLEGSDDAAPTAEAPAAPAAEPPAAPAAASGAQKECVCVQSTLETRNPPKWHGSPGSPGSPGPPPRRGPM